MSSTPHPLSSPGRDEWTIPDLIDLEILVREDTELGSDGHDRLRLRDLPIRESWTRRGGERVPRSRRELIHHWMRERRRDRFLGLPSPGEEIASVAFWCALVLCVAGVAVARSVVWGFVRGTELSAASPEPINVIYLALIAIGLPFLLSLYGFWVLLIQRAGPAVPAAPAFLRATLLRLLQPWLRRICSHLSEGAGAERRLQAHVFAGALRQRVEARKGAIATAALRLVQAFGVAFTAGVLLFLWADFKFYNHVLGWQTTDPGWTSEKVHGWVRAAALPWSWYKGEGRGFPTRDQVDQTDFKRFHDPGLFPPEAAPVWAEFLLGCALVYGLLPRLVLERLTAAEVRKRLRSEQFEEFRFDDLWHRLTQPIVEIPAPGLERVSMPGNPVSAPELSSHRLSLIILPAELEEPGRVAAMEQWLVQTKQTSLQPTRILAAGAEEKERLIATLRADFHGKPRANFLLVSESFMPPVQQTKNFLKALREALGEEHSILVGLIGKPNGTAFGRPPTKTEMEVWRGVITGIGDGNLGVLSFLPPL